MLRHFISLSIVLLLAGVARGQDPCFRNVFVLPPQPTPLDTIIIFAEITPVALDVTPIYATGGDWGSLPMSCINDTCRASIGPFPPNTEVDYYIQAHDSVGYACYSPLKRRIRFILSLSAIILPAPICPATSMITASSTVSMSFISCDISRAVRPLPVPATMAMVPSSSRWILMAIAI
jgi:hypothetical protein